VWIVFGLFIIFFGEIYKSVVKLMFFKGVVLDDLVGFFNLSFEGKVRCVIDIKEDDEIDEGALKKFVCDVVVLNFV